MKKRYISIFFTIIILIINITSSITVKANWLDDTWKQIVDGGEIVFEKLSDAAEFIGQTATLVVNSTGALIKMDMSDLENGAKDYLESLLYIGGYYTKAEVKAMSESELLAAINKYFSTNFQIKGSNIIIPDIFVDSTVKYVNEIRSKEVDYYRISVKTFNYKTELLNSSNYSTGEQYNFAKSLLESAEYSMVYYYTTYNPNITYQENFSDVTSTFNNKNYYPVIEYGTYGSTIKFYDINWNYKNGAYLDYRNGINSSWYYRLFTSDGRYITVFKSYELFKEWTMKKGISNVYITNEFNNYNYNNDNSITVNKENFINNNWITNNNNNYNNVNNYVVNYYSENNTIISENELNDKLEELVDSIKELIEKLIEDKDNKKNDVSNEEILNEISKVGYVLSAVLNDIKQITLSMYEVMENINYRIRIHLTDINDKLENMGIDSKNISNVLNDIYQLMKELANKENEIVEPNPTDSPSPTIVVSGTPPKIDPKTLIVYTDEATEMLGTLSNDINEIKNNVGDVPNMFVIVINCMPNELKIMIVIGMGVCLLTGIISWIKGG